MKPSLNNREDKASHVCKQWYFRSSDVISGHFLTAYFPWAIVHQKMPARNV